MTRIFFLLSATVLAIFAAENVLAQNDTLSTGPETLQEPSAPSTKNQAPLSKTAAKKASGSGNVLDFEGEVIEGERRRPDLFLQMSIDNVKFDSLIYQRDDFNDYLEVDRKSRTRYLKLK